MANPLFNQLNNQQQQSNQFQVFRQNPMQFLANRNLNIPQELANDPHGAVQYLLNNGKMTQQQLNMLTQHVQKMGLKL